MSGGMKKQYKQFAINCKEDACIALSSLIAGVSVNLEKYKEYTSEAVSLLERIEGEFISAREYDNVNDKLLYRQREILKFTADCQNSSFSYLDLRKLLEKKKYVTAALPERTSEILSDLLDIRNWSFHNPQSLMVAAKESAEMRIPKELKESIEVRPQLNPVLITKVVRYEIQMLESLVVHACKRIEQFERILSSMKEDYQEIYSSLDSKSFTLTPDGFTDKVQYFELERIASLSSYDSDIAQVSMAIQKSKYDGTEATFKKWTIRPDEDKANS